MNKTFNKITYRLGYFFLHGCDDEYLYEKRDELSSLLLPAPTNEPFNDVPPVGDEEEESKDTDHNEQNGPTVQDAFTHYDNKEKSGDKRSKANLDIENFPDTVPSSDEKPSKMDEVKAFEEDDICEKADDTEKGTVVEENTVVEEAPEPPTPPAPSDSDISFEQLLKRQAELVDNYDRMGAQIGGEERAVFEDVAERIIENLILSDCEPICDDTTYDKLRHRTVPYNIMLKDGTPIKTFVRNGVAWHGRVYIKAIVEVEDSTEPESIAK